MNIILTWIDVIWLPIAFFVVHKDQRWMTLAFFLSCFFIMRLQIEMLVSLGYPTGFLPLIKWPVQYTGLGVYSLFYAAYILMAYFSPGSNKHIFLAASISIFFAAILTSMVFMVL